jgi:TetR/AcrR family transcriptional repressor of mexJK operon
MVRAGEQIFAEKHLRRGRPRRDEADRLHTNMLDTALDLFLDRGFEQTTLDAIAAAACISKRTIYARYDDKEALFRAAVQQAIDRWIVPDLDLEAIDTGNIDTALRAIARLGVDKVMSPIGFKVHRIMNAATFRFPDLFDSMYQQGPRRLTDFIAQLLAEHDARGTIKVDRPEVAAIVFLRMAVGGSTRSIITGVKPDPAEVEELMDYSIKIFLDAVRIK